MKHVNARLGSRLREVRSKAGLSQTALGRQVGVTQGTIAHYENGRTDIGGHRLQELADALHCDLAILTAPPGAPVRFRFRRRSRPMPLVFVHGALPATKMELAQCVLNFDDVVMCCAAAE